jgi:catechol 2,3-dioxygenase-like lactoylglutathione lyase family enzyme
MAITLNHTIVPARDKVAAARFFAGIFGLDFKEPSGHFAPVHVNETLTLLFSEDTSFDSHHYAFHVSDAEFDAILGRIKKAGLAYGSAPWSDDRAAVSVDFSEELDRAQGPFTGYGSLPEPPCPVHNSRRNSGQLRDFRAPNHYVCL